MFDLLINGTIEKNFGLAVAIAISYWLYMKRDSEHAQTHQQRSIEHKEQVQMIIEENKNNAKSHNDITKEAITSINNNTIAMNNIINAINNNQSTLTELKTNQAVILSSVRSLVNHNDRKNTSKT